MATPSDLLLSLAENGCDSGRQYFARIGSELLRHAPADLASAMEDAGARWRLEPLLFAHFAAKASPDDLWPILYGYCDENRRPRLMSTPTNQAGVACLPGLGYLPTGKAATIVTLSGPSGSQRYTAATDDDAVNTVPAAPATLGAGHIEVDRHHHPLFNFLHPGGADDGATLVAAHLPHLEKALQRLAEINPPYAALMEAMTRRVVLFRNPSLNSFASVASFGAVCLNVLEDDADEVFFIEDLVHQCGHVIFSALTHEVDAYLAVPAGTPLQTDVAVNEEPRSVYSALHGLFTEAMMNRCFDLCLDCDGFTQKQKDEILARFAFIFRRMNFDLLSMRRHDIYTDRGADIYEACRQIFEDIYHRRRQELSGQNFTGQPYTFNYRIFRHHAA